MAALRWRSCCWWDLAYGISLQSPPALLGRQQKKTPTRVIHPAKRKKQAQRGGRAGWEMEGCRWCRRMATAGVGFACMAPMQVGEWLWGSYGDELGASMAGSRVCKTEHPLCEQPELSCCCFLIGNKRGHSLKQRPPVYNALKILRLRKPPVKTILFRYAATSYSSQTSTRNGNRGMTRQNRAQTNEAN